MTEKLRKLSPEEVKKIQLEILDYVDYFCKQHNINYWLDYGTLLGAVRHKGYIPWDDDIDISMLRGDYERFKNEFNKFSNEKYKFICVDNYPTFSNIIGKVIATDTILYEPDENGMKISVNIDVSILDNAPNNISQIKKIFFLYKLHKYLHHVQIGSYSPRLNRIQLLFSKILHLLLMLLPKNYFVKKHIMTMRQYENENTNLVANFTQGKWWVCEKSVFIKTIPIEFEGKFYNAPNDYNKWLKICYNDYMKLPPENERTTHHEYVAYSIIK